MKNQINQFLLKLTGYELRKPMPSEFSDLRRRGLDTAFQVLNSINIPQSDLEEYKCFYDFINVNQYDTTSQCYQDLFVMWVLNNKLNGYFVEFGADDGVLNSNTYVLEKSFGWNGLLMEPNPFIYKKLSINRNSKSLNIAVSKSDSTDVNFELNEDRQHSSITGFSSTPSSSLHRRIKVKAFSLDSILEQENTPKYFDFLSIDVEGHEQNVLAGFTISKWLPRIVIIEHNDNPELKEYILKYFLSHNYKLMLPAFSFHDFWFCLNE